ncbi:hypothetical protein ILYODFUR_034386 [Ilyodon furcidens]|uniref:Uncharacterized protein n=1 Tax=Ilyodon furcidens TaxID=33524 RepID=A0ABV0UQG0_9TELE
MWGLFPPRNTPCQWLVSLPAVVLVVLGVWCWVLWCVQALSRWLLTGGLCPLALPGLCLGSDVPWGLGSLGPWLNLLRHRLLPAGPVGSLLKFPVASALWLLGGFSGTLCSSVVGLW